MAGPVAYSAYASTLKEVIQPQVDLHGYVDDHTYKNGSLANSREAESETMGHLENYASVIKIWMDGNRLKMNDKRQSSSCLVSESSFLNVILQQSHQW